MAKRESNCLCQPESTANWKESSQLQLIQAQVTCLSLSHHRVVSGVYLTGADTEVFTANNLLAYLENIKLGALEQRWMALLAWLKLKIHYRQESSMGTPMLLPGSWHPGEDVDSNTEHIEVVPVLPMPATSCTIGEQDRDPPTKAANLYSLEEWVLIQQKDSDLIQIQHYLMSEVVPCQS